MTNRIPKTCKAAVLEEYGKPLQIREVTIPEVEACGILVKVEMAGIYGTDVHQHKSQDSMREEGNPNGWNGMAQT